MPKKVEVLYPFRPGSEILLHYPERECEWRPNKVFKTALVFKGFQRGRSAAYAVFSELEGPGYYSMFLTDFEELVKGASPLRFGIWFENWTYQKRGQNYGVKLVK